MKTRRIVQGAMTAALGIGLLVGCDTQYSAKEPDTRVSEAPRPKIDDSAITSQVQAKLASEAPAGLGSIDVKTEGGVVQLSGVVATADMKQRAGDIVRTVDGVRDVVNNLDVRSG